MEVCILVFHLPKKMNNSDLGKFVKRFYGQETSTQKGKYRYRRKGLLDQIPHRKLLRGVIIIRKSDLETVMKLLIEWNAVVDQRIIEPTEEDLKMLREVEK
ncbi:MAG: hypothetical protein M1327_04390 [Candidatus Thermoplasmatota archaeon]|nr:hypothetical protein [Candidatus Thermoplasmatota archaeon]